MKSKSGTIPFVIWMAIFVVTPLVLVTVYAFMSADGGFSTENFVQMAKPETLGVFLRSLKLAVIATAFCLLLGYPLAYYLSRETGFLRNMATMLIMLPMWMNFLLRTFAWMSILENTGLINRFMGLFGLGPFNMINTQGAVVLGMVYNYLPFMVLPIFSVITKINRPMIEAAQDLGCSTFTVFRKVIFPLSLPGILSGTTMVFVPSVSTFVISKLLGGGKSDMLGDLIEMQFVGSAYNPHLGSAISLVMMVIVLICMWVMNRFGEGENEVTIT